MIATFHEYFATYHFGLSIENDIKIDQKILMLLKVKDSTSQALATYLKTNHPYECPEIIWNGSTKTEPSYLSWLTKKR